MLRTSTALIWVSLAIFVAILYIILRVFVMRGFLEVETQNTAVNVERVESAIDENIRSINAKASDWAAWDDAYQFVQDGNPDFIRSNVVLSAFTGNNLNLIAYLRNGDDIVYARWHPPDTAVLTPIPEDVRRAIQEDLLTTHTNVLDSVSGIVMLEQGPMLTASRPVVTSDQRGPIRGTLIFGQLLQPDEVRRLSQVTRLAIRIERVDDGDLPSDFIEASAEISDSQQAVVRPISRSLVAGYTLLEDIYGEPALMLRIQMRRFFYNRGLSLANYALVALVILSILFGVVGSMLFKRTIEKEREYDLKIREFYRRTITAASNGKLIIADRLEIEKLSERLLSQWEIHFPSDVPEARDKALDAASSAGIHGDRAWKFATAVVEAVTNAIKHSGGGIASIHRTAHGLLFVMSDKGPGIPALTLPDVALRVGYTTTGTLGMGYKIMIFLSDRVYLATGPEGTTVAIEENIRPEEPSMA